MAVISHTADDDSDALSALGWSETGLTAERSLQEAERRREAFWNAVSKGSDWVLRRRSFLATRSLPVLPGRPVLELGAGSGLWTAHLAAALGGQNEITAAVFNKDLARACSARQLPNTRCIQIRNLANQFSPGSFDYILGMDILTEELCSGILAAAYRWLRPGGQIIFLGPNPSNPLVCLREAVRLATVRGRSESSHTAVSARLWTSAATQRGFANIEAIPCEVMRPAKSTKSHAISLMLDHAPVSRTFSRTLTLGASKPGILPEITSPASLAPHRELSHAVSVVVPCHNEEENVRALVRTLLAMYGDYFQEIIIVDDNSTDRTAEVAAALEASEPRVRLLKRTPPAGVGRALREGYVAAKGRYILSIDADFVRIASEFKGLFDAVAAGHDGAIGSRFSAESALVRYPFPKILSNRLFHWMLNLLMGQRVRDLSNNLKLYRADILKNLEIEENHFAANAENGLKPLLMGHAILEVPVSWINRTTEMGNSSFKLFRVGPGYLRVLLRLTWRVWRGYYRVSSA